MYLVKVSYGSESFAEDNGGKVVKSYYVSTKADANTLACVIDDAQGYLDYEIISIRKKVEKSS